MRRFDPHPVDSDVAGSAGSRRGRPGTGQPYRPDPDIDPPRLIS
jgi:hypothetical protein